MGEIPSLCGYSYNNRDMEELGQKLLWTTLELEKLKSEVMEEMSKNKEYVKQLIQLLSLAIEERDEARNQLKKWLAKTALDQPVRTPSNITESNSLSDTYAGPRGPFTAEPGAITIDHASNIIDGLAKGRVLPEKGKLLHAVLEAGPLLQTLLLSGPLPRWRNPPPVQVSPMAIPNKPGSLACRRANLEACYGQVSNFSNVGTGTCTGVMMSTGMSSLGFDPLAKRQRLC